MIIVVGGIKGGSGKTTLATNLAVIRSAEGHDVLLIDANDQETSIDGNVAKIILRRENSARLFPYAAIGKRLKTIFA